MISILNPVSLRREGEIFAALRIASIEGHLVGLLHNGKHGGEELLIGIRDRLMEETRDVAFEYRRKLYAAAGASFLPSVFRKWKAAIVAVGDCGSYSSWSVYDSVELEKVGIPTVLVVSRPFVAMNRIDAARAHRHAPVPSTADRPSSYGPPHLGRYETPTHH